MPTGAEQTTLVGNASITDYTNAASSNLAFTAAGDRFRTGALINQALVGYYWSSTVGVTHTEIRYFTDVGTSVSTPARAIGFSVRCLKD